MVLGSPPSWALQPQTSPLFQSQRELEEDEMTIPSDTQDGASNHDDGEEEDEDTGYFFNSNIEVIPPSMNGMGHDTEEDPVRGEITHSVTRAYITSVSVTKSSKSDSTSTVKFEGLNISPELIPTLEKIWLKHGNIMEDIVIRNG